MQTMPHSVAVVRKPQHTKIVVPHCCTADDVTQYIRVFSMESHPAELAGVSPLASRSRKDEIFLRI